MKVCRHRTSWLIDGAHGEWCYVCGAYRGLRAFKDGVAPRTVWIKPTGDKDNNPHEKLKYKTRWDNK